ncbi:hypothetical protein ACIQXF_02570 [Lysinibacillus sp. NPDC097231]|uniref:hypothetical protein n=1 Tax=Lysinibacillus sp. NPDC097231 TaxID=3364142 RepID=UPI0037FF8216
MKKYWQTILISLIVVVTIGTYYFQQAAMAPKNDVSFKIEAISGNKEEVENLILQTNFQSGDIHRWLYITKDSSTNRMNRSFFAGLNASNEDEIFGEFIQKYRKFMRGKDLYQNKFFEDEAHLIYTTFKDNGQKEGRGDFLTLQIDTLDKNTNDSSSFKINTPAQASYDWINVRGVYVGEGKIRILATIYLINGGEELHIFTVDENKMELEDDSVLAKLASEERGMEGIRIFNEYNIKKENHFLYMVRKYNNYKGEGAEPEIISSQTYIYNNTTNEVEEWIIPDKLNPYSKWMVLYESYIYIPVHSANGLELNRYNIEKKQWEEPLNIKYSSKVSDEDIPFLKITDGKVYLVNRVSDGHLLFIGDLRTGESLYEGKIILENRENINADYTLNIEDLYNIN